METSTVTINKITSRLAQLPEEKLTEIYDYVEFILHKTQSRLKEREIPGSGTSKRKFGCGKGIFTYVSEDFDEPLPEFKDYMK
jgi:hypothetical protein